MFQSVDPPYVELHEGLDLMIGKVTFGGSSVLTGTFTA